MKAKDRIIVPVDTSNIKDALKIVESLQDLVGMFKFGLELQNAILAQIVTRGDLEFLGDLGKLFRLVEGRLFWDGKWNDIPNTVAGAAANIALLKPKMVNVHASAGDQAIRKVVENNPDTIVLGVTVLTSLSDDDCQYIFGSHSAKKVLSFATMLSFAGADGIICSPQELKILNEYCSSNPLIRVVPGVRPLWASTDDQQRVMTPGEAILFGADYLVIGRPITSPPKEIGNSFTAVQEIVKEIKEALLCGQ